VPMALRTSASSSEDVEESLEVAYREVASLLNSIGRVLTYIIRTTSRPSEIAASNNRYAKVRPQSLDIVRKYSGHFIDFSYEKGYIELPFRHLHSDVYAVRNFYTYRINLAKVFGEVAVGQRSSKKYLVVGGSVIDVYPPQTLRGWIVVSSLYGEDDLIPSVVDGSVPFEAVFNKLLELSDPKTLSILRTLGHVTTYTLPAGSITVVDLDNLYVGSEKITHSVLATPDVKLLDPGGMSLKLVSMNFDDVKKDLIKVVVGIVMFFVNKKLEEMWSDEE